MEVVDLKNNYGAFETTALGIETMENWEFYSKRFFQRLIGCLI